MRQRKPGSGDMGVRVVCRYDN